MADAEGQPRPPDGGARRTPAELEAIVLSILRASPRPLGAYVIARRSRSLGVPLAPNQVYRILGRLKGRVRRVETLNAYFEDESDAPAVTICRCCGRARTLGIELLGDHIARLGREAGFRTANAIVEIEGTCPDCARTCVITSGR